MSFRRKDDVSRGRSARECISSPVRIREDIHVEDTLTEFDAFRYSVTHILQQI